jgi:hypothetical protein
MQHEKAGRSCPAFFALSAPRVRYSVGYRGKVFGKSRVRAIAWRSCGVGASLWISRLAAPLKIVIHAVEVSCAERKLCGCAELPPASRCFPAS